MALRGVQEYIARDVKVGSLPYIINKLRGIPVLKSYANLHLHELDNL